MRFYVLDNGKVDITDDANNLHRFFLEKTQEGIGFVADTRYRLEELVVSENARENLDSNFPQERSIGTYTKSDGTKVNLTSVYHEDPVRIGARVTCRFHPDLQYTETFAIPYKPSTDYKPQYTSVQKVFNVELGFSSCPDYKTELFKSLDLDSGRIYHPWENAPNRTIVSGEISLREWSLFKRWQTNQHLKKYGEIELEDAGKKLLRRLLTYMENVAIILSNSP